MRRTIIVTTLILLGLGLTFVLVFPFPFTPTLDISPETTVIVEPLAADGYPDYLAALNQHSRKNTTPENNAAVLFWQALGPKRIQPSHRKRYFEMLEINPLPDDGNYFVPWWDFLGDQFGEDPEPPKDDEKRDVEEQLDEARRRPWSDEDYPMLASWLDTNADPLEIALSATQRTNCYAPLISDEEMLPVSGNLSIVLLPLTDGAFRLAHALAARALRRLKVGDVDRGWEDLLACYRLSRLIGQGPFLIQELAALNLNEIACEASIAWLHHGRFSVEQLDRFRRDLESLPAMPDPASKLDVAERFAFLDTLIRVVMPGKFSTKKEQDFWDGLLTAHMKRRISSSFEWNDICRAGNDFFDRLVAASNQDDFQSRRSEVTAIFDRAQKIRDKYPSLPSGEFVTMRGMYAEFQLVLLQIAKSERDPQKRTQIAGKVLSVMLMPAIDQIDKEATKAGVQRDQVRLALALAAYQAEQGEFPERLAALVPKHFSQLPEDQFTGDQFRYRRQEDGYHLYSLGPNGQDDAGQEDDVTIETPVSKPPCDVCPS